MQLCADLHVRAASTGHVHSSVSSVVRTSELSKRNAGGMGNDEVAQKDI